MTAGTIAFSGLAVNAEYVSAEDIVFPESLTVDEYTGYYRHSFNIDIDGDGKKEAIGYYYVDDSHRTAITEAYYVYDEGSDPYLL